VSARPEEAVNIGPRERSKRRMMAVVGLTVGVSVAFVLVVTGAPRLLRLVVFLPIWIGSLGLLQAREKT
jgi:hypothetical protein